jgi:hypothetical protein
VANRYILCDFTKLVQECVITETTFHHITIKTYLVEMCWGESGCGVDPTHLS